MLLLLFLSCVGPADTALATDACRGLPGINVDAAGLAFSAGLIEAPERALWETRLPSVGLDTLGVAGLGVIRANSSCRVEAVEGDTARLVREEPALDPITLEDRRDIKDMERVERRFSLTLVDTDAGRRVRAGVAQAREALAAAWRLRDSGDPQGAIAALTALHQRFPDPLLLWEIADLRQRAKVLETLEWAVVADDRLVLHHSADRAVGLDLTLSAGAERFPVHQEALPPGLELVLPLPEALLAAAAAGEAPAMKVDSVTVFRALE